MTKTILFTLVIVGSLLLLGWTSSEELMIEEYIKEKSNILTHDVDAVINFSLMSDKDQNATIQAWMPIKKAEWEAEKTEAEGDITELDKLIENATSATGVEIR